jgi:hypothetical protein
MGKEKSKDEDRMELSFSVYTFEVAWVNYMVISPTQNFKLKSR